MRTEKGKTKGFTRDERGEMAYVETFVTVFAIMILIAFAINVFSFFTLKQDLEYFAEQAIISAAASGSTDGAQSRIAELCSELGFDIDDIVVDFGASDYIRGSTSHVQYGDSIRVTVTYSTKLAATGLINLPVKVTTSSSGLSEKYWKP